MARRRFADFGRWEAQPHIPLWRWGGGIYALYQGSEVVYVGRTGNFRSRLTTHKRRFWFDGIKVVFTDDLYEQKYRERRLISRLVPTYNRMIPRMKPLCASER